MAPPPNELRATFSRRNLLKSGLVGTAVVALSGVGLALQKTALVAPIPGGLAVLSSEEYAVLTAIADRLCPARKPGFPAASELKVPEAIDAMFEHAHADEKDGFKLGLSIFESALSGAMFGERLVPFTKLAPASQDRVLRAWQNSSIGFRRTVYTGLSSLIQAVYWGNPGAWSRVGYSGPLDPAALRKTYADNLVDWDSLRATAKQTKGS
jgi:hypothetical protein